MLALTFLLSIVSVSQAQIISCTCPLNRYFPSIQIKNESIFLPCCLDFDFPLAHLIFVLHKIQMALKVRVQPVSAAVMLELAIAILFAIAIETAAMMHAMYAPVHSQQSMHALRRRLRLRLRRRRHHRPGLFVSRATRWSRLRMARPSHFVK